MTRKLRASHTNGRISKKNKCTYNVDHNDRNFESEEKEYDEERTPDNEYKILDKDGNFISKPDNISLKEFELEYYMNNYSERQNAVNEKAEKSGHKERCRSITQVYENAKTAPQENISQIGKEGEFCDLEKFKETCDLYAQRHNEKWGEHARIIDYSIHADESSLHCHFRKVFDYENKDGHRELNQTKALENEGFQLPNPEKSRSKNNNVLMDYTAKDRELWYQCIEETNKEININREPELSGSKRHLETLEYKNQQKQNELNEKFELIDKANNRMTELKTQIEQEKAQLKAVRTDKDIEREHLQELKSEWQQTDKKLTKTQGDLSVAQGALDVALQDSQEAQQMARMAISMMQLVMSFLEKAYKRARKEIRDRIHKLQADLNRAERAELRQNYYEEHLKPLYQEMSALKKELEKPELVPFKQVKVPESRLDELEKTEKQLSIAMKKLSEKDKTIKELQADLPSEFEIRDRIEREYAPIKSENSKLKRELDMKDLKISTQEDNLDRLKKKVKEYEKIIKPTKALDDIARIR